MDRVKGVNPDQADETAKTLFQTLRKEIGLVPRSKLLAAYDNPTLMASTRMDGVTAKAKTVSPALKELAQLKVAVMVGCPF